MNERRLSVDFITESVGMSTGMLTENLSMTKVSAGWVPTAEHVIRCSAGARAETSVSLLSLCIMKIRTTLGYFKFVTVDEIWLHHYDPKLRSKAVV